ncbi:DUF805 domain-containing protein [Caulobacter sp. KR2-114]|uniref:DUF805 domain-containing protein n=1 Tax=Caulobacter sp. KR2-114 TaxID=3400912 RepID=UPI003BFEB2CD
MGNLSPVHWLIILVVLAAVLPPMMRILRRTGHSGWWALLYFVPLVGWIGLWVFAYARWPAVDSRDQASTVP